MPLISLLHHFRMLSICRHALGQSFRTTNTHISLLYSRLHRNAALNSHDQFNKQQCNFMDMRIKDRCMLTRVCCENGFSQPHQLAIFVIRLPLTLYITNTSQPMTASEFTDFCYSYYRQYYLLPSLSTFV